MWDLTIEKFLLKRTGTRIGTLIYPRVSEDQNKISNRSSARTLTCWYNPRSRGQRRAKS